MKAAFQALYWELLRKNRLVFGALALLLAAGATAVWTAGQAQAESGWPQRAEQITVAAFMISLLIGIAPFTLMESQGGWRMNSMITRWFVLPIRTLHLVVPPMLLGGAFVALLVGAWLPILNRLAPGLDGPYLMAVLATGVIASQAFAWVVPRRPGQFWAGAAILFPLALFLGFAPQDQPGEEVFRRAMRIPLFVFSLLCVAFAWYAASRNRCGDWPGELPFARLWQFLRQGRSSRIPRRPFRSPAAALFWSDARPLLRLLTISWLALILVMAIGFSLTSWKAGRSQLAFSWGLLAFAGVHVLPVFAILWLAIWGLLTGGEAESAFRTRLPAFRATLPVACGTLAAQRLVTVLLGSAVVWLPLLLLSYAYDPAVAGTLSPEDVPRIRSVLARMMGLGLCVGVGALPVFLLGRFDGFPNLLLAGTVSWIWVWMLNIMVGEEASSAWRGTIVALLFAAKFGVGFVALARAWHAGQITWRFPLALTAAWCALAAILVWGLPLWRLEGPWVAAVTLLLLPFARPALCPLAIAANRHR